MPLTGLLLAFSPGEVVVGNERPLNPYGLPALGVLGWLPTVPGLAWLVLVLAAAASLVARFRVSGVEERARLTWLLYAVAVTAASFAVDAAVALLAPAWYGVVFPVVQLVPATVVMAAGIAILRHRLFDIGSPGQPHAALRHAHRLCRVDLRAGGRSARPAVGNGPVASVLATGVVAVAFAPLRTRPQRGVDRLLYGGRADPYRALALPG